MHILNAVETHFTQQIQDNAFKNGITKIFVNIKSIELFVYRVINIVICDNKNDTWI